MEAQLPSDVLLDWNVRWQDAWDDASQANDVGPGDCAACTPTSFWGGGGWEGGRDCWDLGVREPCKPARPGFINVQVTKYSAVQRLFSKPAPPLPPSCAQAEQVDPNAFGAGSVARGFAGGSHAGVAGKPPAPEPAVHAGNDVHEEEGGAATDPAASTWDAGGALNQAFAEPAGSGSPRRRGSGVASSQPAPLPRGPAHWAAPPDADVRAVDGPSDALLRAADMERRRAQRDAVGSGPAQEERHLRSEIALLNRKVRAARGRVQAGGLSRRRKGGRDRGF